MTKLSLTILTGLVTALLVSSQVLGSGRGAHHPEIMAIGSSMYAVTQSRSHPQSRLTRQAYKRQMEGRRTQRSSVPINQPGRDSFIPVSVEQGAHPTNRFFRQDDAREEILILFKEQR